MTFKRFKFSIDTNIYNKKEILSQVKLDKQNQRKILDGILL